MKIIQRVFIADDDTGEVEGMFQGGKLLDWWCSNDANWRDEYFSGFMKKLGFKVEPSSDPMLIKLLRKAVGQV